MQLTTAEKRVYGFIGLLLAAFLVVGLLGYAYAALLWLGLVVPAAFLVLLVAVLWRGRRHVHSVTVDKGRR